MPCRTGRTGPFGPWWCQVRPNASKHNDVVTRRRREYRTPSTAQQSNTHARPSCARASTTSSREDSRRATHVCERSTLGIAMAQRLGVDKLGRRGKMWEDVGSRQGTGSRAARAEAGAAVETAMCMPRHSGTVLTVGDAWERCSSRLGKGGNGGRACEEGGTWNGQFIVAHGVLVECPRTHACKSPASAN